MSLRSQAEKTQTRAGGPLTNRNLSLYVQMKRELEAKAQNEKMKELQSYKGLMDKSTKMMSNKDIDLKGKSVREIEEDFM